MLAKQIIKLSKVIMKLKDTLKCAICLDVIQETDELECGHKFCSECFLTYNSYQTDHKQTSCPLCKAGVGRRTVKYEDEFSDSLGSYISNLSDTFRQSYGHDVERIAQFTNEIPVGINRKKATTSKCDDENRSNSSCSSQDAFEMLLNQSPDNKETNIIYLNKEKENKTHLAYRILDFGDNENKSAVLRWLNDTKNRFERLTRTQIFEVESNDNVANTGLVSISQIRQNGGVPQLKSRARSLDIEVEKNKNTKIVLAGSNIDTTEKYIIEDTDTKEEEIVKKAEGNFLLDIIGDQALDELESEPQNKEIQDTTHKNPLEEAHYSQPSTSGWKKYGNISETPKKEEKAPNKLKTTFKSSLTSNFKKKNKDSSKRTSKNEGKAKMSLSAEKQYPVYLKNVQNPEKENAKTCAAVFSSNTPKARAKHIFVAGNSNENPKLYELNAVETYISENMEFIEEEDSSNISDLSNDELEKDYVDKENDKNFGNIASAKEKKNVLEHVLRNDGLEESLDKELEGPYLLPTQKLNTSSYSSNDNSEGRLGDGVILEPTQKHQNNISNKIDEYVDCGVVEADYESFEDLLSTLQKNLKCCQNSVNIKTIKDKLGIANGCATRLRKFSFDKTTKNTPAVVKTIPSEELCEKDTQTLFSVQTKQVQTESCESINKKVQTDDCVDGKLDLGVSRSSKHAVNEEGASKSQKSTKSALMCSLSSEKSNKVNRKLTYHDSFGTKSNSSESDDDVFMPKKLCDRFLRDDLSMEFDIYTESDSDNVGYEFQDYLDTVLKKFDDNDCLITTPEKNDCRKDKEIHPSVRRDHEAELEDKMMEGEDLRGQTKSLEPSPKRARKTNLDVGFDQGEFTTYSRSQSPNFLGFANSNTDHPNVCQELDDSLDDAEFANIKITGEKCLEDNRSEQVHEHTEINEERQVSSNVNEDLYSDIVETNPRQDFMERRSQRCSHRCGIKSDFSRKDGLHSSTPRKLSNYTSCNLSPITVVKSAIEASARTPSSIPIQSSRKQNILTSALSGLSTWNYATAQNSDSGIVKSKPCIACTRLSKDNTRSISLLTNKELATYSHVFDKSVTHMIVSVTDKNWIKDYTMKFVAAVAAGVWILNFEWVQECLNSNSIVPEGPYEVLDDIGMPGPRTARLTRKENPLLKGFKFYCANSLFSTTIREVEDIVTMVGGKFVSSLEKLLEKDGTVGLIITDGRSTQDFEVYGTWLHLFKTATVDIEWLSKSVGRYKLLSIRPYIWCSDDNLEDLGYPPHILEMVQSSSEQY